MYTPSEKTQIILHDFSPVYMLLKHQKHCYIIRTLRVIQQETGYIWLISVWKLVYIYSEGNCLHERCCSLNWLTHNSFTLYMPCHAVSDQAIHFLFALTFTQSTQKERQKNE